MAVADQWNGVAANVQASLPTSKSITSTSNATPIVVTTSTPHLLKTGDYVRVSGATDTSANGDWIAFVLSGTTFSLQVIPTGADSTPGGGGGAAGTIISLNFGTTYAIPTDNMPYVATTYNVADCAVGDRTSYLMYRVGPNGAVLPHAALDTVGAATEGFPNDANQGDFKFDGDITIDSGSTLSVDAGGEIQTVIGGTANLYGETNLLGATTRTGDDATYADRTGTVTANAVTFTIDVTKDTWTLDTPTPAGNISNITVKSTSPAPPANSSIEFAVNAIPGINTVNILREDASVIAKFGAGGTGIDWGACRLKFISSRWRLVGLSVDQDATGPGRVTPW